MPFGVFAQDVYDNTSPRNAELVGEVVNMDEFLEKGGPSKSSCDGQTSATPPRYADDNMMLLYFDSEERAAGISELIRNGIATQINSGAIVPRAIPAWLKNPSNTSLMAAVALIALSSEVRDKYPTDTVSDSQLITASEAFMQETGRVPTYEELLLWIAANRDWEETN